MSFIDTFIEYITASNTKGKRAVRRYNTNPDWDLLGFFSPTLDTIKNVLPDARGLRTAENSLSVVSAEDRPLDIQEKYSEGDQSTTFTTSLGGDIFIDVSRFSRFSIQIENTGSTALNAFEIRTKNHSAADVVKRYGSASDYSSLNLNEILISVRNLDGNFQNPFTLDGSAKVILDFDLSGYFVKELNFRGSVASGTTTIDVKWAGI